MSPALQTYGTQGCEACGGSGAVASPASAWPLGEAGVRAVAGAVRGLAVPSVQVALALPAGHEVAVQAAQQGLVRLAQELEWPLPVREEAGEVPAQAVLSLVRRWVVLLAGAIQQVSPILDTGVTGAPQGHSVPDWLSQGSPPQPAWVLYWPTHWPTALAPVLWWSLRAWRRCCDSTGSPGSTPEPALADALRGEWQRVISRLKAQMPSGVNPPKLLAAAHGLGFPVLWLDRETLQLGHGRRARVFQSTLSDATPSMFVAWARDKVRTNRLLRQVGLPVPRHHEVPDVASALAAAKVLGWPVVVKPADQDRGAGARANLRSDDQLLTAFAQARQCSRRVLVEKHQPGREYRLTVVQGKLFWAHERVPAAVTGDGHQTLQQLVEAENARRRQSLLTRRDGWMPIPLDETNRSFLQESGRDWQDIPSAGEVVRLQRVPAATTGGGGLACFDTIHPDNRLLAERAAQVLRLDMAGVDVIMPDITRSWREVGGALTEVNAIPQLSIQTDPTLPYRLLQQLMPHGGRIPVLLVLANDPPVWLDQTLGVLGDSGLRVGLSTPGGLRIGTDCIREGRHSLWDDIRALQVDPSVDAMAIVCDGSAFMKTGLPFDAVDAVVVQLFQPQVMSLLMPALRGLRVVIGSDLVERYAPWLDSQGPAWETWRPTPDDLTIKAVELGRALLTAHGRMAAHTLN